MCLRTGPVILAANHSALLDGPVLVALTRRLTFAMAKRELFVGIVGRVLAQIGQISLNRQRARHSRRSAGPSRCSAPTRCWPCFPRACGRPVRSPGRGAGPRTWRMVTGAPVVPVAMLGTREAGPDQDASCRVGGGRSTSSTARRSPSRSVPWPRRKRGGGGAGPSSSGSMLAAHVVAAQALTGLPLPGPPRRSCSRAAATRSIDVK